MAGLLSLLSNTANALNAQQSVAAVASNNLANVDTAGYSRESANLNAAALNVLGGVVLGGGVSVGSVTQTRDRFIEAQLPGAQGAAAFSQAQSDSLSAVDALNPSTSGGLTDSLSQFFTSMQALSQDAGNQSLRTAAVADAQQLAQAFNTAHASITSAQTGLDTQVSNSLGTINSLSAQMASLNKQIRLSSATGQTPNQLMDARQNIQDQLVALTGAHPVTDVQGDVSLALPDGDALVSADAAATLSAAPDPTNNGHVSLSILRTDGTGPYGLSNAGMGGQVGGWLNVRDGALKSASDSLDTLATDFSNAINAAHSSSYALDNSTGNPLFTLTPGASAAGSITVNTDIVNDPSLLATKGSAAAGAGDASGLQSLIDVQNTNLSLGSTASGTLATITGAFGSATETATETAQQDATSLTHLTTLRSSASGVSSDEELVNMQRAQSAYEAMSKVITTTQTMLDALMAIQST